MNANEPLRIALLTAHLTSSGSSKVCSYVRQLARALDAQPGIALDVLGPAYSFENFEEWGVVQPRTATPIGPSFFRYAPSLARRLKDVGPGLVHLHGLWTHPSAVCLGFTTKTGKPHVVSPHGMLDPVALKNYGWRKQMVGSLFEGANLRSAACLHALNATEEEAIREYGFRGPICIVPTGIKLEAARQGLPAPWWTKKDPNVRTILYLGRLHPRKCLAKALMAWSMLEEDLRKEWRLVIAGWDEAGHLGALRRISTTLQVDESVTFTGGLYSEDKQASYQHCDGFLLPSIQETLPMSVVEAWAHAKPVLMTDACNLPEGFAAGAAIRIEPDEESIAQALREFMTADEATRKAMGEKGYALAREKYSWEAVAEEMAGVYRWIAADAPRPACVTGR